jgi:hypothetical protein
MTEEKKPRHELRFPKATPPGRPEITCRICGNLRIPKQKCDTCYKEANIYRKRDIRGTEMQVKLRAQRQAKIKEWKQRNYKKNSKSLRKYKKVFALYELDRLLSKILDCFERDTTGEWQVYADRMEELRAILDETSWLLPKIRTAAQVNRRSTGTKE